LNFFKKFIYFALDHKLLEPKGAAKTPNLEKKQTDSKLQKEMLKNQFFVIKTQIKWSPFNKNRLIIDKKLEFPLQLPEFEDEFEEDLKNINGMEPNYQQFPLILKKKSLNMMKFTKKERSLEKINDKLKETVEKILHNCNRNLKQKN